MASWDDSDATGWLGTVQGSYVHWWLQVDKTGRARDGGSPSIVPTNGLKSFVLTNQPVDGAPASDDNFRVDLGQVDGPNPEFRRLQGVLPAFCLPSDSAAPTRIESLVRSLNDRDFDDDPIILGIIDSDIALTHERFRTSTGKSRILSAWIMGEKFGGASGSLNARIVPYGLEVFRADINAAIGMPDQDAAELSLGTSSLLPLGSRGTAQRTAHGTHVLDLAAGTDPQDTSAAAQKMRDRVRILAVSLPSNRVIGPSGTFLEPFAQHALQWIAIRAAGLKPIFSTLPIQVVVNLSYGLAAGPRDGSSVLSQEVSKLTAVTNGDLRFRVLMPAGNNNLDRGHAVLRLGGDVTRATATWLVAPENIYSAYAEIWLPLGHPGTDLTLTITPPGQPGDVIDLSVGNRIRVLKASSAANAPRLAGVYRLTTSNGRKGLVLCIAPTRSLLAGRPPAPPGPWLLTLGGPENTEVIVQVQVQSSRPLVAGFGPHAPSLLQGDDDAALWDRNGDLADTYDSLPDHGGKPAVYPRDNDPEPKPGATLRRKGTLNAIAVGSGVAIIGGFRVADALPRRMSASGLIPLTKKGAPSGLPTFSPTYAYPETESPMLPGLLAAGYRSGSVAVVQGTSFATALATRDLLTRLIDDPAKAPAIDDDTAKPPLLKSEPLKVGAGKKDGPTVARIDRRSAMPHP